MALVMAQMPDVWRKVLAEHLADPTGRCAACRNANGETASWPCQTYRVAQEAKWVSEGNLPGTGPHGPGVNASPRVSPPSRPFPAASSRRHDDGPAGYGYDLPNTGGLGYGVPTGGGFGYDLPSSGGFGYESPGTGGFRSDAWPSSGPGYDAPSTGAYGGVESYSARTYDSGTGHGYTDPRVDDAATTFGGADGNAPALASLPPLPPSASSTSDSARPRHGSPDYYDAPRFGSVPDPDPLGPYGSSYDSPSYGSLSYGSPSYGSARSEPGPRSAPSPGFSTGAGFGDGPRFDTSPGYGRGDGTGFRPGDGFGTGFDSDLDDGPADPFAADPQRRSSWGGDESRPYGSTVDAPYGSTFGVDDRPRGSRR